MQEAPRLRVPDAHRESLGVLARIEDAAFDELYSILTEGTPTLVVDEMVSRIAEGTSAIERHHLTGVIEALVSLHNTLMAHQWAPAQVARGVAESEYLTLESAERATLASRLEQAVTADLIEPLSRSIDVISGHERLLHGVRIISDIRPVFQADPELDPVAAVVAHTLRIDFVQDYQVRSLSVALDNDDLATLGAAVDRAMKKTATLMRVLDRAGIERYSPGGL